MYDSICWWNAGEIPMMELFYNHEAYNDYPVVGVNYASAKEFCKWLTEKYNSNPKKKYKKVIFRLPTEEEFKKAACYDCYSYKTNYPWGNEILQKSKNEKLCNYWDLDQTLLDYENKENLIYHGEKSTFISFMEPVGSFLATPYGLFDIVGNVAEMIQEENVAMGGSWQSTGYNVRITSKKTYDKPQATVGFRVYMEIVEFQESIENIKSK